MKRKSMLKAFALPLTLSLLLTACGGGSATNENATPAPSEGSATETQKEVSFTVAYAAGDPVTRQAQQKAIEAFMTANPHIKVVDISDTSSASYLDFLKTKDAVGEFPDLVEMRDTQFFADAGKLAELPEDLVGLFNTVPEINGKVYNAPITIQAPQGIIYSKAAYEKAGITEEPKTYGEFLEIQEKLKASGIAPIVVGGKDIWHMGFWINKFFMDEMFFDDPNWNSKRSKGEVSFTDPGPVEAMTKFTELFTKGYVEQGFMSTADNQTPSMLITGKAASLFSGPWMFPLIAEADPTFEFGFYPVPDENGRVVVNGLPMPTGWTISAKGAEDPDKVEAMKTFIKFFFAPENYAEYLKAANALPTTKEPVTYEASPQMTEVLALMADPNTGKSLQINQFWGENQMPTQWRNWFYKLAQEWLLNGTSIEENMAKADVEWDVQLQANQQ
ncbi:ABC transporter substrate-binding protein [Paenibacillus sp.]|uniref:ABC transporter substrate-binding protein n=1 Tax=Paenibacillus sp. TaxID=58172 RepID=UPI002D388B78|nr:extracellular solute-binding protein [Paenibacillus sp.]HZG88000.1 extracellular solute-binding protein [Paenibacillus sp.]